MIRRIWKSPALSLSLMQCLGLSACDPPPTPEPPPREPPEPTCPSGYLPPVAEVGCPSGSALRENGCCQPAGLPPDMPCPPGTFATPSGGCCAAGTVWSTDDTCEPAGIPPAGCAAGFVPDGEGGCDPVLPTGACEVGTMAIPGESVCAGVAECGEGTWGNIPVDGTTEHVDGAYDGSNGDSDGSADRPWTSIEDALIAADPGAIVAVAAGTYDGVDIKNKPVRLWGRCPAMVELVGAAGDLAAIEMLDGDGSGTEIHQLGITGASVVGIVVSGVTDVVLDRLWVHDMDGRGIDIESTQGPTSAAIAASLIEHVRDLGVFVMGSTVTMDASVVRDTLPIAPGVTGWGVDVEAGGAPNVDAHLAITRSVVEHNREAGIFVRGGRADIHGSVVRDTVRSGAGPARGVNAQGIGGELGRSNVTIQASVIERNDGIGVFVAGSDATIETTVVRDTLPGVGEGQGIHALFDAGLGQAAAVNIVRSTLHHNSWIGVLAETSTAVVEGTIIRDTQQDSEGSRGSGVVLYSDLDVGLRASVALEHSVVERNHDMGVLVQAADITIGASVIRDTAPEKGGGRGGRGVGIQDDQEMGVRGTCLMEDSVVESNREMGVFVGGSDATIDRTVIRATLLDEELSVLARGVGVENDEATKQRGNVTLTRSLIEQSHELGVFVGGSDALLEDVTIRETLLDGKGTGGRGITIQDNYNDGERSAVTVRRTLVENNHEFGILVAGADAIIDACSVLDTRSNPAGEFGDGIAVIYGFETETYSEATAQITQTLISGAERAGISAFGASPAVGATTIMCSAIPMNADPVAGKEASIERAGPNQCSDSEPGCERPESLDDCRVDHEGIEPPKASGLAE